MDRCIADVRLARCIKGARSGGDGGRRCHHAGGPEQALGSALYVEAVATQFAVHLLRNYASVTFREPSRTRTAYRRRKFAG